MLSFLAFYKRKERIFVNFEFVMFDKKRHSMNDRIVYYFLTG